MIEVRDLSVTFGTFTLADVNITLPEGRCLAILGPSGAGKTLLLESVMGARGLQRGSVKHAGRDITTLPPEQRGIAYIPQDLALFPHLSVRDNVLFGVRKSTAQSEREGALEELAAELRIAHVLDRGDVRTLSGGEQQRVALARALIVRPRVLFLDEPFSALDSATRIELLHSFRALRRQLNMTVFLVTHDLEEAALLADDIALMMAGRILQAGPSDEVLQNPRTVAAARFLGFRNIVPTSSNFPGDCAAFAIHSERIAVRLPSEPIVPGAIRAVLLEVMPTNTRATVTARLDDGTVIEATLSRAEALALQSCIGSEVAVRIPAAAQLPLVE